jgi:hypothetical protein
MKIARLATVSASASLWLTLAANALAQTASTGSASTSKGGTTGALPEAGSTEITYAIFIGGVLLFVFAMLKFILSFREAK